MEDGAEMSVDFMTAEGDSVDESCVAKEKKGKC